MGKFDDWQARFAEDGEIGGRVATKFGRTAEQQHAAMVTADFEVPGDDEPVSRVVAFPTYDDHRPLDAQALQDIDAAAAGVLHQYQAAKTILFDRAAIQLAALFAGKNRDSHTLSLCPVGFEGNVAGRWFERGARECRTSPRSGGFRAAPDTEAFTTRKFHRLG